MKRLFVSLSSLALLSIVAVHVAALSDVNIFDSAPWIWVILFVGILIPFVGFLLAFRAALGLNGIRHKDRSSSRAKLTFGRILGLFPVWARCVIVATYVYAGVLFFSVSGAIGQATIRDGRFVLMDRGQFLRELTRPEYEHLHARDALVFCGFLMVFVVIPLLYFLVGGPDHDTRKPELHMKQHTS